MIVAMKKQNLLERENVAMIRQIGEAEGPSAPLKDTIETLEIGNLNDAL